VPLSLVIHDLAPESPALRAMVEAIYQIAPEHWPVTDAAVLVETDVSPAYLLDHLERELALRGARAGRLLVTPVGAKAAWSGLPTEGETWLRDKLAS
jgi:hypothetical protein